MTTFQLPPNAEWYNKKKGIYIERYEDRSPEWHQKRMDGIGGSECGSVLGLNDYPGSSVIELFFEKVGQKPIPKEDNKYMFMGRVLESVVADLWQYHNGGNIDDLIENANKGNKLRKCRNINGVLTNIKYPHLFFNLDRLIEKGAFNLISGEVMKDNSLLEIKTASSYMKKKWEIEISTAYISQATQGCMILDVDYAEIATLFLDTRELEVYPIEPRDSLKESILDGTKSFWYDRVVPAREIQKEAMRNLYLGNKSKYDELMIEMSRYEPPADGTESYKLFMNERWKSEPVIVKATDDMIRLADELMLYKELSKEINKDLLLRENQIREILGENDTLQFGEKNKITWKSQVDGKRVMRTAGYITNFDYKGKSEELADMIRKQINS